MDKSREIVVSLLQRGETRKGYMHFFDEDMFDNYVDRKIISLMLLGFPFNMSDGMAFRKEAGISAGDTAQLYIDYDNFKGWLSGKDYESYSKKFREERAFEYAKKGEWKKVSRALKVNKVENYTDTDFYYKYLKDIKSTSKDGYIGFPTGIRKLDNITSGLIGGKVWIIGGYNAYGKTFFMTNMVNRLISMDKRVCVLTLEMNKVDIISRLIMERTKVGMYELAKTENKEKVEKAYDSIKESIKNGNLVIIDNVNELDSILPLLKSQNAQKKIDVLFVDFIQLITDRGTTGIYENTRNVSIKLQGLTKELGCCSVLLSQISNESQKVRSSSVYGFKGAGEIGQIADVAIRIIRKIIEGTNEFTDDYILGVVKNRTGECGGIECTITFPSGHIEEKFNSERVFEGI